MAETTEKKAEVTTEEIVDKFYDPEAEVLGNWHKTYDLPKLENIKTGEEDEDMILKMRTKIYRFRDGEWKERGKGNGKLLRHKEHNKIRFLLRQDGTLKIMANFLLEQDPLCALKEFDDDKKAFAFMAMDFSEGEKKEEKLFIRLTSKDNAEAFKSAWEAAREFNALVAAGNKDKLVWAPIIEPEKLEKEEKKDMDKDGVKADEKKAEAPKEGEAKAQEDKPEEAAKEKEEPKDAAADKPEDK